MPSSALLLGARRVSTSPASGCPSPDRRSGDLAICTTWPSSVWALALLVEDREGWAQGPVSALCQPVSTLCPSPAPSWVWDPGTLRSGGDGGSNLHRVAVDRGQQRPWVSCCPSVPSALGFQNPHSLLSPNLPQKCGLQSPVGQGRQRQPGAQPQPLGPPMDTGGSLEILHKVRGPQACRKWHRASVT